MNKGGKLSFIMIINITATSKKIKPNFGQGTSSKNMLGIEKLAQNFFLILPFPFFRLNI